MSYNAKTLFAFSCESENGMLLSNKIELEAWDSIENLVSRLTGDDHVSPRDSLFSWRTNPSHSASAKETYRWREVIDSIKTANLESTFDEVEKQAKRQFPLIKSRPVMLRIAGEITNALLHSYSYKHKIRFSQCDSIEPSGLPI